MWRMNTASITPSDRSDPTGLRALIDHIGRSGLIMSANIPTIGPTARPITPHVVACITLPIVHTLPATRIMQELDMQLPDIIAAARQPGIMPRAITAQERTQRSTQSANTRCIIGPSTRPPIARSRTTRAIALPIGPATLPGITPGARPIRPITKLITPGAIIGVTPPEHITGAQPITKPITPAIIEGGRNDAAI